MHTTKTLMLLSALLLLKLTAHTQPTLTDTLSISNEHQIWNIVSAKYEACQEDVQNYTVALDQCLVANESADKVIGDLTVEKNLLTELNAGKTLIIGLQEQTINKDALIIEGQKNMNIWGKVGWGLGGTALGAIISSLANIIKAVK